MLCAAINQVYNRHNRGAAVENEICSALCSKVESGVIALKSDAATPIPRRATAISGEAQYSLPPINDLALAANRAYGAKSVGAECAGRDHANSNCRARA